MIYLNKEYDQYEKSKFNYIPLGSIKKSIDYFLYTLDPYKAGLYDNSQLYVEYLKEAELDISFYRINFVRCINYIEKNNYWNSSSRAPVFKNNGRAIAEVSIKFIDLKDGGTSTCNSKGYGKTWFLRNLLI